MTAQTHLAADEQLFILGQLMKPTSQLIEGDVLRTRDATQFVEFGAIAHVQYLLMGVTVLYLGCVAEQGIPFKWLLATKPAMLITSLAEPKGGA